MRHTKEQIRAAAPELADFADDVRSMFPGSKVTYLKVDALDFEQGLPIDPANCAMVDTTPLWKLKLQWTAEEKLQREELQRQFKRKKK